MIDERLSRDIEVGAKAKPRYETDVIRTDGGWEVRNSRHRYPLFSFEFTLEPGDQADGSQDELDEFVNLFHVAGGMFETFKFRHWSDYSALRQPIGTGDGATSAFQLLRVYTAGAISRTRKITRPVTGTVIGYVDGAAAPITVDYTTGIITFASIPAAGKAITASFEFDIPVRFDSDELEMVALMTELDQPVSILLKEVRE